MSLPAKRRRPGRSFIRLPGVALHLLEHLVARERDLRRGVLVSRALPRRVERATLISHDVDRVLEVHHEHVHHGLALVVCLDLLSQRKEQLDTSARVWKWPDRDTCVVIQRDRDRALAADERVGDGIIISLGLRVVGEFHERVEQRRGVELPLPPVRPNRANKDVVGELGAQRVAEVVISRLGDVRRGGG